MHAFTLLSLWALGSWRVNRDEVLVLSFGLWLSPGSLISVAWSPSFGLRMGSSLTFLLHGRGLDSGLLQTSHLLLDPLAAPDMSLGFSDSRGQSPCSCGVEVKWRAHSTARHRAGAELTAALLSFSCFFSSPSLFLSVFMSSLLSPYYSFSFSFFTLILLSFSKLSFLSLGITLPKVNI